MNNARIFTAFIATALSLFAQSGNRLTFEAASIKPVAPSDPFALAADRNAAVADPGRLEFRSVSFETLMQMAWHVRTDQIVGPDWIRTTHYDFKAKIPEGATRAQVPEMLRSILTERFGLVVHEEQKVAAGYALLAAKSGVKLASSEDGIQQPEIGKVSPAERMRTSGSSRALGNMRVKSTSGGVTRIEGNHTTMAMFCATLTQLVGEPVTDETNLKGAYDVALELPAHDLMALTMAGSGRGRSVSPASSEDSGLPRVMDSLAKMGLRMEPRKISVTRVVVDKGNSKPTEN